MPQEQRTRFNLRRCGVRRPAALAVAAVLSLNMVHASAWASSVLTTVVGGAKAGAPGFGGDGGPATAAQLDNPSAVAVDGAGNVFVADTANQRIRRIDAATGTITTLAGGADGGAPGFAGDRGPAASAQLNGPLGVAVDGRGNVVFADTANQRIRRIDAITGVIATVAGGVAKGAPGFGGDGAIATRAQLNNPSGVAFDGAGNLLIADTANQRIRRIDAATGTITTIAGGAAKGAPGFGGDGGTATKAQLNNPSGVAVDGAGNVLVADTANQRIRRIDAATGIITTLAGGAADGAPGFGGDGGSPVGAQLSSPAGVAVDSAGNVSIADTANQRIRRIDAATGVITTLAGGAETVVAGSGSDPATPPGSASPPPVVAVRGPLGLAVDRAGAVLVANSPRNRIDKAVADPAAAPADATAKAPAQPTDPSVLCQLAENGGATSISTSPSWMTRTVSVTTLTAQPGQQLGVAGNGFSSGQQLTVTLCSMPTVLGSITADSLGSYRASVRIPANVAPGAHHLVLSDASGNAAVALRVQAVRSGPGLDNGTDPTANDPTANDPTLDDPSVDDPAFNDPSVDDPAFNDPSLNDPAASDSFPDLGTTSTDGTDTNGLPTTGAEFIPLLLLAGTSLKLGGALVLAGRRKSPAR